MLKKSNIPSDDTDNDGNEVDCQFKFSIPVECGVEKQNLSTRIPPSVGIYLHLLSTYIIFYYSHWLIFPDSSSHSSELYLTSFWIFRFEYVSSNRRPVQSNI